MKALLLSLVAASSLAAAVTPAAAQSWDRGDNRQYDRPHDDRGGYDHDRRDRGYDLQARVQDLSQRVDEAQRDGRIDRATASYLRRQIRVIRQSAWSIDRDGVVTGQERAEFDRKCDFVTNRLEIAIRGGERNNRYGSGYGDPRR